MSVHNNSSAQAVVALAALTLIWGYNWVVINVALTYIMVKRMGETATWTGGVSYAVEG